MYEKMNTNTKLMAKSIPLALLFLLLMTVACQRPRPVPLAPAPAPSTQYQYSEQYVTAYRLNVRSGPSTKDRILAVLKRGEAVQVMQRSGNWLQVRRPPTQQYADGFTQGWVYGAYLTEYQDVISRPNDNKVHNTPPQGWDYTHQQPRSMQQSPAPQPVPQSSGFGDAL